MKEVRAFQAFTLAELLIALAILGVIATFTIPKVLVAQTNAKFNAIGKETAAMVSGAYQTYQMNNSVSASTKLADFTDLMNYVKLDTVSTIDRIPGSTNVTCTVSLPCLKLHNGAIMLYQYGNTFGGTSTQDAVYFYLDPDGKDSGTTNGDGKSIVFFLYPSGRVATWGTVTPGTTGGTYNPTPANDPSWFSWN